MPSFCFPCAWILQFMRLIFVTAGILAAALQTNVSLGHSWSKGLFASNTNQYVPALTDCYDGESSMFLCIAAAGAAVFPPVFTAHSMAKETVLQRARSYQLFKAGPSSPMTSRAPTPLEDMLHTAPKIPGAPKDTRPDLSMCHPMAGDAMEMWDLQWQVVLEKLHFSFDPLPSRPEPAFRIPAPALLSRMLESKILLTSIMRAGTKRLTPWIAQVKALLTDISVECRCFVSALMGSDLQLGDKNDELERVCREVRVARAAWVKDVGGRAMARFGRAAINEFTPRMRTDGVALIRVIRRLMKANKKMRESSKAVFQSVVEENKTETTGPGASSVPDVELPSKKAEIAGDPVATPPQEKTVKSWWTTPIGGRGEPPEPGSIAHQLQYDEWD